MMLTLKQLKIRTMSNSQLVFPFDQKASPQRVRHCSTSSWIQPLQGLRAKLFDRSLGSLGLCFGILKRTTTATGKLARLARAFKPKIVGISHERHMRESISLILGTTSLYLFIVLAYLFFATA
jgi:hypothetical protein